MRNEEFENDKYYHIYNRGIDGRVIFGDDKDFLRFLLGLRCYNNNSTHENRIYYRNLVRNSTDAELSSEASELSSMIYAQDFVDIVCYCLNPTHYHLLLRQKQKKGIEKFMHKLGLGYTNYFNNKHKRKGSLFQGTYQSKPVNSYSHLLKLMVYINCNAEVHGIAKKEDWVWSSFLDYAGLRNGTLCDHSLFEQEFRNEGEFISLCDEVLPDIKEIKKIIIE